MTDFLEPDAAGWLERFHAGERRVLDGVYREHFALVMRAVGAASLVGVDRETVVHDVFLRLLTRAEARQSFRGGSFSAWLTTLARNQAIDYQRARQREGAALERFATEQVAHAEPAAAPSASPERAEAQQRVERFQREVLPAKWRPVFEARFLRQLSQREAAAALGMRRTTLAYQELRIRSLLRDFFLSREAP